MTCCERLFHTRDAATGNDRSPTVARRVRRTASIDDVAERSLHRARETIASTSNGFATLKIKESAYMTEYKKVG